MSLSLSPEQAGDLAGVERELRRGAGPEELGIALMWACSQGKVSAVQSTAHWMRAGTTKSFRMLGREDIIWLGKMDKTQ
jgi:hypothetical protein